VVPVAALPSPPRPVQQVRRWSVAPLCCLSSRWTRSVLAGWGERAQRPAWWRFVAGAIPKLVVNLEVDVGGVAGGRHLVRELLPYTAIVAGVGLLRLR